jgi:hypothetical protein
MKQSFAFIVALFFTAAAYAANPTAKVTGVSCMWSEIEPLIERRNTATCAAVFRLIYNFTQRFTSSILRTSHRMQRGKDPTKPQSAWLATSIA